MKKVLGILYACLFSVFLLGCTGDNIETDLVANAYDQGYEDGQEEINIDPNEIIEDYGLDNIFNEHYGDFIEYLYSSDNFDEVAIESIYNGSLGDRITPIQILLEDMEPQDRSSVMSIISKYYTNEIYGECIGDISTHKVHLSEGKCFDSIKCKDMVFYIQSKEELLNNTNNLGDFQICEECMNDRKAAQFSGKSSNVVTNVESINQTEEDERLNKADSDLSTEKSNSTDKNEEIQKVAPDVANTIGNTDIIVHITDTGSKYHNAGCQYLKSSDIEVTLQDAKSRGLTPCSKCNPPQ